MVLRYWLLAVGVAVVLCVPCEAKQSHLRLHGQQERSSASSVWAQLGWPSLPDFRGAVYRWPYNHRFNTRVNTFPHQTPEQQLALHSNSNSDPQPDKAHNTQADQQYKASSPWTHFSRTDRLNSNNPHHSSNAENRPPQSHLSSITQTVNRPPDQSSQSINRVNRPQPNQSSQSVNRPHHSPSTIHGPNESFQGANRPHHSTNTIHRPNQSTNTLNRQHQSFSTIHRPNESSQSIIYRPHQSSHSATRSHLHHSSHRTYANRPQPHYSRNTVLQRPHHHQHQQQSQQSVDVNREASAAKPPTSTRENTHIRPAAVPVPLQSRPSGRRRGQQWTLPRRFLVSEDTGRGRGAFQECRDGKVWQNGECQCPYLSNWDVMLNRCECVYGTYRHASGHCRNYF